MNYQQLVTPNLDPEIIVKGEPLLDWLGWCMGYVSSAFQIFGADSAHIGWTKSQSPHSDKNFPVGVYIPIWFDWWGDIDGTGVKNWGHVAIYKDGQVWSSPLTHKPTADAYPSFDAFVTAFANAGVNIQYVGWSEDLMGKKVVTGDEPMFNEGDRVNQNNAFFGQDKGYFKEYVDKMTYKEATEKILGSAQYLAETRLNDGDLKNISDKTGWPSESAIKGWLWKRFWEDYASNKVGSGVGFEPVDETLYRKKG